MARDIITAERLRASLSYDPETGIFTRIGIKRGPIRDGNIAGTQRKDGYRYVEVCGVRCAEHRLAWFWTHGRWPQYDIDHIDGDPSNNRIANLRDATDAINHQNLKRAQRDNKSGFLGVSWHDKTQKWRAQICAGTGKSTHLGYFDSPTSAHAAYLEHKRRLHPGCTI